MSTFRRKAASNVSTRKRPVEPSPKAATGADPGKRHQILEGAWGVFTDEGLEGASVDELARGAGVSKPTIYKYFESKEAIFHALLQQQVEIVRGTRFELTPAMGPPDRLLARLGVGYVTALMQQRTLDSFRLLISEAHRFPGLGRSFEEAGPERGHAALTAYLRELHRAGTLRIDDPTLAAQQFIAMCECGLMRRAHTRGERPTKARIESMVLSAVRTFLRGYSAD